MCRTATVVKLRSRFKQLQFRATIAGVHNMLTQVIVGFNICAAIAVSVVVAKIWLDAR